MQTFSTILSLTVNFLFVASIWFVLREIKEAHRRITNLEAVIIAKLILQHEQD